MKETRPKTPSSSSNSFTETLRISGIVFLIFSVFAIAMCLGVLGYALKQTFLTHTQSSLETKPSTVSTTPQAAPPLPPSVANSSSSAPSSPPAPAEIPVAKPEINSFTSSDLIAIANVFAAVFSGILGVVGVCTASFFSYTLLLDSRIQFAKASSKSAAAAEMEAIKMRLETLLSPDELPLGSQGHYQPAGDIMKRFFSRAIDAMPADTSKGHLGKANLKSRTHADIDRLFLLERWLQSQLNKDIEDAPENPADLVSKPPPSDAG